MDKCDIENVAELPKEHKDYKPFLTDKRAIEKIAELLEKNPEYKPFVLKKLVGRDKQGSEYTTELIHSYRATSQADTEAFLKVVVEIGSAAPSVYGATTGIPFKPEQTPRVDHITKANAKISVFAKAVAAGEWEVYGIGFHSKWGGTTYDMDTFYQPIGSDSPYAKGKEVKL